MKQVLKIIVLLGIVHLMCGCHSGVPLGNRSESTVYFVFDTLTSKSLVVNDGHISNCCIMVYDIYGSLVASSYNATGIIPSLSFACDDDTFYKFYCVCNIGDITSVSTFGRETGLANYQYSVVDYSDITDSNGAVPMSGNSGYMRVTNGMNVYIDLTRCVALVTIRIDDSGLDNAALRIDSVTMYNVPRKVRLFGSSAAGSASDCVRKGDKASSIELTGFNNGSGIGFYMFENAQGQLLPDNQSSFSKYFSAGSAYNQICTYVELKGYYDDRASANARYGDFRYRFYLGENTTTDFSILRNHHYLYVLEVTDSGVDEISWRVDEYLTPYATAITVSPGEYTFNGIEGNCTLTATVLPASASQDVTWSTSNAAVATVNASGIVTPTGYGTATITATATDGSGISGSSQITVLDPAIRPTRIEPNYLQERNWLVAAGSSVSDFEITVFYDDGSSRILTGDEALATVQLDDSNFTIENGVLTANDIGGGFDGRYAELYMEYTENTTTVTYTTDGAIFIPDDLISASYNTRAIAKSSDLAVAVELPTSIRGVPVVSGDIALSASTSSLERVSGGYRLKDSSNWNGPLGYSITARFTDAFGNLSAKTVNCNTAFYTWRERYYLVKINTSVRESIDTSFGSQEQPDNVIVSYYLVCTGAADTLLGSYYFPASYDQYGNLDQYDFSYTWYDRTLTQQMMDYREYRFNYDRNGNYLTEGYCVENGQYIYYEPF